MSDKLKFKKLKDDAILPTRGSDNAAGLDLYSTVYSYVRPNEVSRFSTGISVAVPDGYYGRIAPRSGLAAKQGIDVLAGVIDADYRGELIVLLTTHSSDGHYINYGDKIAQFIIEKIQILEPEWAEELDKTVRGTSGFGSTGQ